ncbi:MAG: hemerythrin domain-containing protein [Pelomonas sp.]|nr:hemerythrin domain-containing protein [Roseateles sp.]
MRIGRPGAAAGPSFATPLAMLLECHRRIEAQCDTLARLVPHVGALGSDAAAAEAAQAVIRYFELAAPNHHADEELDLFPALLEAMAGSDAVCLREMTATLAAEHQELERRWAGLHATLERIARGQAAVLSGAEVDGFASLYRSHIAREEAELLPMAERLIDAATLERIGAAMRRRRGASD